MPPSPSFCIQCGSQLPSNARYCNDCGATIDAVAPTELAGEPIRQGSPPVAPTYAAPTPQAEQPVYQAQPARPTAQARSRRPAPIPKKSNRILPILGILGGGLICLAVGAGLTFYVVDYLSGLEDTPTPLAQAATATHASPENPPTETPIPPTAPPESPSPTPPEVPSPTLPESPPTTVAAPTTPPGRQVSYANTTFYYDPVLAQNVNVETVPESNYADAPYFDLYPEHSRFEFVGYPLYPDAFHTPQMMIYPAANYSAINPEAQNTIIRLQNLLQSRPTTPPSEGLPFLPIWNAAQMMRAQIRYLDFHNGSGVRYLSQYGQSYWPINSQDMFYTFQGLTSDGAYYISAVFPVSNPILPDPNTVTMDDAFYNNYETYVHEIENQLNAQPDSSFTPNLALLDSLLQSLVIR